MNQEENISNKCPICNRPTHKESKYCIFHASAEEKTEEEFKEALKEYVDKIKKEDGDYDFKKFIFVGDIIFKEDLNVNVFKNAGFAKATFEGNASFGVATFKGSADFRYVTFKGSADFRYVTFEGNASFGAATFKESADFKLSYIENTINFSETRILSGKRLYIRILNEKGKINFNRAYLENTDLDIELVENALIDFADALLGNTKIRTWQIKNHILQEKKNNYHQAKEIYFLLKKNFHSIGQYEDESWAFKKEKDMERKSNCHFKTLDKWLWSCFLNGIFGYGEQPIKIIVSAILVILFFALSFSLIGLGNPEIIELKGTAIHSDSGNIVDLASKGLLKNNVIRNFPDSLYFSTITFTTLGYGDFRPLEGWGRILAGSEAFIGAFMMALFVYTFARRTGGR
jgi:uncharacterized protein YjbI with pentapeptide repeats